MYVDAGGVRLWVRHHAGDAAGTPVVLLHGFAGTARTWEPLIPELASHARVLALDLVGHGRSDAPRDLAPYAIEACAAQVLAVTDQLGIGLADWLGYSMGGRVALQIALSAPDRVRRLVLESASPGIADPKEREARRAEDEALAARIEREGIVAFAKSWEQLPIFASQRDMPGAWQRMQRDERTAHKPWGLANSLRGMGQGAQASQWDRLPLVRAPTLLVGGALDAKYAAILDAMAARMPGAERARIPGAGHNAHAEQPEAFLAAVGPFLARAPEPNP